MARSVTCKRPIILAPENRGMVTNTDGNAKLMLIRANGCRHSPAPRYALHTHTPFRAPRCTSRFAIYCTRSPRLRLQEHPHGPVVVTVGMCGHSYDVVDHVPSVALMAVCIVYGENGRTGGPVRGLFVGSLLTVDSADVVDRMIATVPFG